MTDTIGRRRSREHYLGVGLMVVGVAGLLVRLIILQRSHGSNDINLWESIAGLIRDHSLGWLYDTNIFMNHPPLISLAVRGIQKAAAALHYRFDVLFKLPQVGADLLAAIIVYRVWRPRGFVRAAGTFACFCWNPVSILISAHHGNTDPLCATLALLAAFLLDGGRALSAGLALAAAINVKLIPVLLIPLCLSNLRSPRQIARFVVGLSVGVIPFAVIAVGHWDGFYEHVLNYRAGPGTWGVTSILDFLSPHAHLTHTSSLIRELWAHHASKLVLGVPVVVAAINVVRPGRWSTCQLAAIAFASFIALGPGGAVQYAVYPVPVLFAADLRRALAYSVTTGLYLFVVYYALWTGTRPYFSNFYQGFPAGGRVVGHLAWLVTVYVLITLLRRPAAAPAVAPLVSSPEPA